jgi:hypothetical protein
VAKGDRLWSEQRLGSLVAASVPLSAAREKGMEPYAKSVSSDGSRVVIPAREKATAALCSEYKWSWPR